MGQEPPASFQSPYDSATSVSSFQTRHIQVQTQGFVNLLNSEFRNIRWEEGATVQPRIKKQS